MQDSIPLIVKRWIKATPERLYQAFQDARSLPQWFIPDRAIGLEVKAYDFAEGGRYIFRYHMPDGRHPVVTGQFTNLSDPAEISFSWNWQSPDPFENIPMHVHFGFIARDGGTDVTITHTGIPTHMACTLHENGWEGTLHHLEQHVLQLSKTKKGKIMRKLALLTFQTLDGVMQAPSEPSEDYSDDFQQGGWAAPYWEEVMEQVRRVAMADPYDMLFGRKTYELFAPHWSTADPDSPEAKRMNSAKKYVVTNSLKEFSWTNSTALSGEDLPGEIAALKQQEGPLLQVHGSWQLIQMLLEQNLVDELRLWTFPILVGRGKRLFSHDIPLHTFDLITSDRTQKGVFHSLYQRRA